uniref:PAS domain-containing protein n=1 Tax=Ascaris lumbricoides TaxID=6252 RepID=A0A0M3IQB1_ASCLU
MDYNKFDSLQFVLVQGRYLHPAEYYQACMSLSSPSSLVQPVFAAYCQPLINPENAEVLSAGNTSMFRSLHLMDMKFLYLDEIGVYHLGYRNEDLEGDSWYRLLHPAHLHEVSFKHRLLCQEKEGSVICLLRLQSNNGAWLWLHTVLAVRGNFLHQPQDGRRVRHLIHATYQLLSDLEATTLQANSWIYSVRQSFPLNLPCKGDDLLSSFPCSEQPVTSILPSQMSPMIAVKNEQVVYEADEESELWKKIRIEIPGKRHTTNSFETSAFLTPDHSSPDSGTSLTTASNRLVLDEATKMCLGDAICGPLPELRDDLDEFFRAVECPPLDDLNCMSKEVLPDCSEDEPPCTLSPSLPLSAMLNTPFESTTPHILRALNHRTKKYGAFRDACGSQLPSSAFKVKEEWFPESGTSPKSTETEGYAARAFLTEQRSSLVGSRTVH